MWCSAVPSLWKRVATTNEHDVSLPQTHVEHQESLCHPKSGYCVPPTRRPHHQTTPSTASNAPSYDEYYDDYYYKEYDTYPSNDLLDSKWKGYTIADQKRKDAHRNEYESASIRTTPTTTTRTTTTSRPTTARTTASTTSRSTSSSKEYPYLKPDNYNQIKPFGKEDCEDFLCDIKDTDYPL